MNIILSACLAFVMVNVLQLHLLHPRLNFKPMNCAVCLSGWIALGMCWHEWYTPFYMAAAMVVNIFIGKLLK